MSCKILRFVAVLLQVWGSFGRKKPNFILRSDVEMVNSGVLDKPITLFADSKLKCVHACNQLSTPGSHDVNMRSFKRETGRCGCFAIPASQFADPRDTLLDGKETQNVIDGNHRGWNIELIYYPSLSGEEDTLTDLLLWLRSSSKSTTTSNDLGLNDPIHFVNSENFVNDRIHDNLHKADEIMLVFYDESDQIREELRFKGTNHVWSWFSAENAIGSSHWELPISREAFSVFSLIPDPDDLVFEITKTGNGGNCESTGWFKLMCNNSASQCGNEKITEGSCVIAYSQFAYPVPYSEASFASKLEVLTKLSEDKDEYQLVFLVEAFAGVSPAHLLIDGDRFNYDNEGVTYAEKIFRHPVTVAKIEEASVIKFEVYDFETSKSVSSVIFKGNSGFNCFGEENVISSTLWNLESTDSPLHIEIHRLYTQFYMFRTWERYPDICSDEVGWVAVYAFKDAIDCSVLEWWNKEFFTSKGLHLEHQPPFILYANSSGAQPLEQLQYGGRIEISVK